MSAREIAEQIIKCFKNGNKLLIVGNGGSAAEAQHMAAELIGKFMYIRKALPALALTTDTSIITSIGNDLGFENIFVRQLDALGKPGDILLCISTSCKSKDILNAKEMAKFKQIDIYDLPNVGESNPEIQENHLKLIHLICRLVEEAFV
jgi:D-sedoheptulose 7-phosphate isomerase